MKRGVSGLEFTPTKLQSPGIPAHNLRCSLSIKLPQLQTLSTFIFIVAPCILKIHKLLKPTNALICLVLF
jgi:hypothetical protein